MLVQLISCASIVLSLGCDESAPNAGPPGPAVTPVVVALGDSLTEGWGLTPAEAYPALLQSRARTADYPHRIVNAGVSGDTSADGLRRLDAALGADTRVLILALGANDGLRGVPIAELRANLSAIIERAQSRGIRVLLCGMETPPAHGLEYSLAFHRVFPELAER
jgi:acyl-CoA thioesterase I